MGWFHDFGIKLFFRYFRILIFECVKKRQRLRQWHRKNEKEKDTGTESKARYREKQSERERDISQIQRKKGKREGSERDER